MFVKYMTSKYFSDLKLVFMLDIVLKTDKSIKVHFFNNQADNFSI